MQKRKVGKILCVLVALLFTVPCSYAMEVTGYDALYKGLSGAGTVDNSVEIKNALKYIKGQQLQRNRRVVEFTGPKELLVLSPAFVSISFDATVQKAGSARQKKSPAVFAFLFESSEKGKLEFLSKHTILWKGKSDLGMYKKMSPELLCRLYRDSGAKFVYLVEPRQAVQKMKPLKVSGSDIQSGIVKAEFIDPGITRDRELKAALAPYALKTSLKVSVAAAPVVSGPSAARIARLEKRIQKLEALLENVARNGNDVIFSGVNVRVNNGTGSTGKVNGLGNLMVGYGSGGSGSHNVAVGSKNSFSSSGGLVTGSGNTISGKNAVAAGGSGNVASGKNCIIAGGEGNKASGEFASILGGRENKARGKYSSINGQQGRTKGGGNQHFAN